MSTELPRDLLLEIGAHARQIATDAGALLVEQQAGPRTVEYKDQLKRDPVTDADKAAEARLREAIHARFPDHVILGEEGADSETGAGEFVWALDPLDGTANFLPRIPHWAVSVACEDAAGVLLGVVHDPLRDEWFAGARGRGATLDGAPLRGSAETDLRLATLGGEFSARSAAQADCSGRLLSNVGHVRNFGSCALDLAWAAAGRVDAAFNMRFPSPWDVRAGELLCREAGLTFERLTDPSDDHDRLLAAPPALAPALREVILGRTA